jgi:hypothetical protein
MLSKVSYASSAAPKKSFVQMAAVSSLESTVGKIILVATVY